MRKSAIDEFPQVLNVMRGRDADVVFHAAAQAGVRASWSADFRIHTDNDVLATQLLLEAGKAEGVDCGRFGGCIAPI